MPRRRRTNDSPLQPPGGADKVLLLSCCAVCCGEVLKRLTVAGLEVTLLAYGPNIHPEKEYARRRDDMRDFARREGVDWVELPYDPDRWHAAILGLEDEPERGPRCEVCFAMRMEAVAQYASENGFTVFTSTLGISRYKDLEQVNRAGHAAAARHEGLSYWDVNWRKGGGSQRMHEVAREENFYRQNYCGCVHSARAGAEDGS